MKTFPQFVHCTQMQFYPHILIVACRSTTFFHNGIMTLLVKGNVSKPYASLPIYLT